MNFYETNNIYSNTNTSININMKNNHYNYSNKEKESKSNKINNIFDSNYINNSNALNKIDE